MKHPKYSVLAVLLIICLLLGSCGGAAPSTAEEPAVSTTAASEEPTTEVPTTEEPTTEEPTTEEPTTEEPTTEAPTTEEPTTEEETEPAADPITIEARDLINTEEISVAANSFYQDEAHQGLNLSLSNRTDKEIALCCTALIINDYMFTEPAAIRIPAGITKYSEILVSTEDLLARGIAEIGQMEIDFKVIDPATGETICNPDPEIIQTSCFDGTGEAAALEGTELYHDNDVLISLVDTVLLDTGATRVNLFVDNASAADITLVGEKVKVNGRLLEAPICTTVCAGRKALCSFVVTYRSKEKLDIGEVLDTLELSLLARDAGDWKLLFKSGTLTADISGSLPSYGGDAKADSKFVPDELIIDEQGIKVTTKGFVTDETRGFGLKLQVENMTDKALRFLLDCAVVNDYVLDNCGLTLTVGSAQSETAVVYFDPDSLDLIGIDKIGTIDLYCSIQDPESFVLLHRFDAVTVNTAAAEEITVIDEKKGVEVYNENDLNVVVIGYSFSEAAGARLYLWVKNSSDKAMVLNPVGVKVNDTGVLSLGDIVVKPGKMAIGAVTVPGSEITSHAIQEFRGMVFSSEVYDEEGNHLFTTHYGGLHFDDEEEETETETEGSALQ